AALHFEPSDGAEGNGGAIHRRYRARIRRTRTGRGVRGSSRARRSGGGRIAGSCGRGNRLGAGRTGSERRRSQSRTNVDVLQFRGILPKFGLSFKHDVVLVQLRVQGRNLPLPKSIVEHLVDRLRRDAHAGRGDAVDDERGGEARSLLVGSQVAKLRNRLQFGHELGRPEIQFALIGIFDGEVLYRLHVERDAIDFFQIWLEPPDDIRGADFALFQRLQIDLDTPAVQCIVGGVDADERRKTLYRRILQEQMGELLLLFRHSGEGDGLPGFRNALNDSCVLNREETLRDDDVENDREHQCASGHKKSSGLAFQYPL